MACNFMPHRRSLVAGLAAAFTLPALAQSAADAAWPARTVKIVVGFPGGSSTDLLARLIAEHLAPVLGKPVIVENRPGAGGNIGVDLVARSTDGHTFGVTTLGPLTTSPLLYRQLPYDVARDLQPLSLAMGSPQILIVDPGLPVHDIDQLVAYAKANPGKLSFGSVGVGSGSHLTGELFAHGTGAPMVHVPFSSFAQVTNAILGAHIQVAFMAASGAMAQAKAGKVRVLGVTSAQPSDVAPGVPTVAQAGRLRGFEAQLWNAAYAPGSMPRAITQRLAVEINTILRSPDAKARLHALGWQSVGGDPEALTRLIASETERWGSVIRTLGITLD